MDHLAVILLGAVVAAFVQGLSGFGFAMTSIAIWAWVLDPRLTATLGVFGALAGQVFTMISTRRGFGWRAVMPFLLGAIAGLPVGLWLLPHLDIPMYKAVLGTILVVTCPLMFFAPKLPKVTHGGRVADGIAGALGGVMGGLGGSTGVVPTLWCTLRGFDKDEQRSIIQNFNLAALAVTFASYVGTGIVTRDMLPVFAIVVPAIILPSLAGRKIYLGISELGFRKVVLGLLTAAGLAMLGSALPVLLSRGS
ncbi:sulfite exporter TauE/SafE family protein [Ramlibacter albus]|uniref:Probable membrane transporter protein n=1 Tax=Ramlibacter albus TaxID=2079448 RepID=A0A923MB35_9BURK|nr:sulfite exporter TauE/SafE family protein [Ramlibacter albus]MBC5766966.1 sulfite exporter TauE/SafE family protein [Ramlibacter albus]